MAYDLKKVFALNGMKNDQEICDSNLNIPADSFLQTRGFAEFIQFRKYKQAIANGEQVNPDSVVASNPQFYQSYILAGDLEFRNKEWQKAIIMYQTALSKEIATRQEEIYIRKQIDLCHEHGAD
jgi:hypothetical protein